MDRKALGVAVRTAREGKQLSQDGLAKLAGCSRPQVSRIESGARAPSFELFSSICDALGLDVMAAPQVQDGTPEEPIAAADETQAETGSFGPQGRSADAA